MDGRFRHRLKAVTSLEAVTSIECDSQAQRIREHSVNAVAHRPETIDMSRERLYSAKEEQCRPSSVLGAGIKSRILGLSNNTSSDASPHHRRNGDYLHRPICCST